MIAATLACLLLVVATWGLARPLVQRLPLDPGEGMLATLALSLLGAYGLAWGIFIAGAPPGGYRLIPLLGVVGLAFGGRGLPRLWSDPAARELILGQLIVTLWGVTALAFVRFHSGGAWTGDALEHWQRARFFLHQWPAGRLFIELYQLPARPPLGNVLCALFLEFLGFDYARFQLVMVVLCSLAFLPLAVLARRWGGPLAVRAAVVAVMANPLFLQNCTYPWTKLLAAAFLLSGLYFLLRVRDGGAVGRTAGVLCGLALGGALVAHYSAGPYVVILAAAWLLLGFRRRWAAGFGATTVWAALGGAAVLASWFGWSLATYGGAGTFLSNSTVSMIHLAKASPLATYLLNIRDTVIPPQVRGYVGRLFQQTSPWGNLRDQFFLVYQLNPVFALGCVGWIVTGREAYRAARAEPRACRFWIGVVAGVFFLSFASYADRDHYGLGHLWFHALVLLGVAFLAARWGRLEPAWRRLLVLGWGLDFLLGIGLQLAVEDFALDRWLTPERNLGQVIATYTGVAQANFQDKVVTRQPYFADLLSVPAPVVLACGGVLIAWAGWRLAQGSRPAAGPAPGEGPTPERGAGRTPTGKR